MAAIAPHATQRKELTNKTAAVLRFLNINNNDRPIISNVVIKNHQVTFKIDPLFCNVKQDPRIKKLERITGVKITNQNNSPVMIIPASKINELHTQLLSQSLQQPQTANAAVVMPSQPVPTGPAAAMPPSRPVPARPAARSSQSTQSQADTLLQIQKIRDLLAELGIPETGVIAKITAKKGEISLHLVENHNAQYHQAHQDLQGLASLVGKSDPKVITLTAKNILSLYTMSGHYWADDTDILQPSQATSTANGVLQTAQPQTTFVASNTPTNGSSAPANLNNGSKKLYDFWNMEAELRSHIGIGSSSSSREESIRFYVNKNTRQYAALKQTLQGCQIKYTGDLNPVSDTVILTIRNEDIPSTVTTELLHEQWCRNFSSTPQALFGSSSGSTLFVPPNASSLAQSMSNTYSAQGMQKDRYNGQTPSNSGS